MSSKKHRKRIRAQYEREIRLNLTEESVKEVVNSSKRIKINSPKLSAFVKKIEVLMRGKNNFLVYLTKTTQGKFVGTYAQAGNYRSSFEVFPSCDEIHFSKNKNRVNVRYIRVYSDFPSSITDFMLSEIEKVEEILETE